jgi:phage gp29-like protein
MAVEYGLPVIGVDDEPDDYNTPRKKKSPGEKSVTDAPTGIQRDIGTNRPGRPPSYEYTQLPVMGFAEWDRVGQVRSILHQLRLGYFRDAAILVDQMFEDDRIMGNLNTRTNGLLGAILSIKPARDGAKYKRVANAVEKAWDQMLPSAEVANLMRWGLMLGIGIGELVWDTSGDFWMPRLKVWHPQFVYWRWDTRSYWLITQEDAQIELPQTDKHIHSDGKWVLYTPYGAQQGWLRGLVRSLAMIWLLRQWAYRDWARYNEVHGIPIKKAIVPGDAEKSAKGRFANAVANVGAESVVVCPQVQKSDDGDKYDVELLEAKADTYEGFEKLTDKTEKSYAVVILGQDASDKAQGGALQQSKDKIRDDIKRFDAKTIAETLYNQVIYWFVSHNYSDPKLTPRPEYDVEPTESEHEEARALNQIAQAIPNLIAGGADIRAILEYHGIPTLEPDEMDLPNPGAPPGGFPPAPKKNDKILPPTTGPDAEDTQQTSLALRPGVAGEPPRSERDRPEVKRIDFRGIPVCIEHPAGTIRYWREDGQAADEPPKGMTTMLFDYGYIEGTDGADGDELDVYLGHDVHSEHVYVVHQRSAPDFTSFDQDKVFLGFASADQAKEAFLGHRPLSEEGRAFGGMSVIPFDVFKSMLTRRHGAGPLVWSKMRMPPAPQLEASQYLGERGTEREARQMVTLRAQLDAGPPQARRRRRAYLAQLERKSTARARQALEVDLKDIWSDIAAATSFEDLRARLKLRYQAMQPDELAAIIKKARIMAELDGRFEVIRTL